MRRWRQLRWRIVAANMIIVVVGVALVLIMAQVITLVVIPANVESGIAALLQADDGLSRGLATDGLLAAFRRSILATVSVAARVSVAGSSFASVER